MGKKKKMLTNILMLYLAIVMMFLVPSRCQAMVSQPPSPSPQPDPSSFSPKNGVTPGSLLPQECGTRCGYRCSKTAFKKPCMFFCQKCCAKCLCVPAGTYGNKQTCPCYNNWKTKRGGPKCP